MSKSDYDIEFVYPYRSEDIRIDQKMLSLFQVVRWIEQGSLLLRPEFQRNFIWKTRQKSLLIESLMLKIPIPAFYFDEDEYGNRSVIDGLQRLTTISQFVHGEFRLKGLQYLEDCEGKYYQDLEWKYQARIEDTQLAVNILDAKCPPMVKFDVFHRINTGGIPLNAQEVRNIMAKQSTRDFLIELVKSDAFQTATHGKVSDERMEAQELCLRFFAYDAIYDRDVEKFVAFSELSNLLDQMLLRLNELNNDTLELLKKRFLESMNKCYALFGEDSFYKPGGKKVVNKALFTSFSVILSEYNVSERLLKKRRDHALERMAYYFKTHEVYSRAIQAATSSRSNVETQFRYASRIVEEVLN